MHPPYFSGIGNSSAPKQAALVSKSERRKPLFFVFKGILYYYCPLKLIQLKKKNGLNSG